MNNVAGIQGVHFRAGHRRRPDAACRSGRWCTKGTRGPRVGSALEWNWKRKACNGRGVVDATGRWRTCVDASAVRLYAPIGASRWSRSVSQSVAVGESLSTRRRAISRGRYYFSLLPSFVSFCLLIPSFPCGVRSFFPLSALPTDIVSFFFFFLDVWPRNSIEENREARQRDYHRAAVDRNAGRWSLKLLEGKILVVYRVNRQSSSHSLNNRASFVRAYTRSTEPERRSSSRRDPLQIWLCI